MVEFSVFFGFGAIIVFVTVLAFIFRFLRQPLILAYIIAGILLGEAFFNELAFRKTIDVFSQLGIAFLLFLVGLSLEPKALKQFGKVSVLIGMSQIIITTVFGFILSSLFGFNALESLYIGLALTFSSTIIVVKYLTDKKELSTLHGRISIGAMLVQDFFSIAVILLASSFDVSSPDVYALFSGFLFKGIVFFSAVFLLNKFIAKKFFFSAAKNQELLLLSGISWCLLLSGLAQLLGFSLEVGAFVGGVMIASFPYSYEISSKLKSLRDFFIVLFFVVLGAGLALASIEKILGLALILSLFVIVVQPLLLLPVMFYFGYKAKPAFAVSMTMGGISEFSIIFIALGFRLSHISQEVVSLVATVAVISMGIGTLMLYNTDYIFDKYFSWLRRFERKQPALEAMLSEKQNEVVFLGFGEAAKNVYMQLGELSDKVFLVDFDPSNVQSLEAKGFKVLFADAQDTELLDKITELSPKIIFVSTDIFETNAAILKSLKKTGTKIKKICAAQTHADAKTLYSLGADFVVVPKMASADKTAAILTQALQNPAELAGMKEQSLGQIEKLDKDF